MELVCSVQQYAWGKIGLDSAVASLAKDGYPDFELEHEAPYAELWMGTHPNGPSKLAKTGHSLKHYLDEKPEQLGESTRKNFGDRLPFLFKVLSVNKALSIQAHPDKKLAEELHATRPDLYKDNDRSKALCDFEDFILKYLSPPPLSFLFLITSNTNIILIIKLTFKHLMSWK